MKCEQTDMIMLSSIVSKTLSCVLCKVYVWCLGQITCSHKTIFI